MNLNVFFLNYRISLNLKEIGFNDICIATVDEDDVFEFLDNEVKNSDLDNIEAICSPTHLQAMEWLKKTHGVRIHDVEDAWVINDVFGFVSSIPNKNGYLKSLESIIENALSGIYRPCKNEEQVKLIKKSRKK